MKFGFIMIRHVNSELTNKYWIESYNCIRKFYDHKIVIIDDNSNELYLTNIETINCEIIQSKYEKRGELLAYYYYLKMKLFDKAVILHDSVFIKRYIDFMNVDDATFLWDFELIHNNTPLELKLIGKFPDSDEILSFYNKKKWVGCFGIMSVMSWDMLNKIDNKYKFFDTVLMHVIDRDNRMCLERIFACVCYLTLDKPKIQLSLFGDIFNYIKWGTTFEEYQTKEYNLPVMKVWTFR